MERASIIDRDQLDKISKKIRRAIAPGFQYIDINKLLESATGSASFNQSNFFKILTSS
jgi:hypothetical protein